MNFEFETQKVAVVSAQHVTNQDWDLLDYWCTNTTIFNSFLVTYRLGDYGYEVIISSEDFQATIASLENNESVSPQFLQLLNLVHEQKFDRLILDVDAPIVQGLELIHNERT